MARFIKDAASAAAASPISPSPATSGGVKFGSKLVLLLDNVVVVDILPASSASDDGGNGKNVLVVCGRKKPSDNGIWSTIDTLKITASSICCFIRDIGWDCCSTAFIVLLAFN